MKHFSEAGDSIQKQKTAVRSDPTLLRTEMGEDEPCEISVLVCIFLGTKGDLRGAVLARVSVCVKARACQDIRHKVS